MSTHLMENRRKLRLWEALALSLGLMGPTLAMGLNGPGVSATAGPAVPLVFTLGLVGVALVAYGFVRLTSHFNHAGSVYALAGATIGPRAGFFGGFALLGAYSFFTVCTLAATGVFFNAWAAEAGISGLEGVPWILVSLVAAIFVALLNSRESHVTARTLLVIEGIGILTMLILSFVIAFKTATGNAPSGQTFDLSTFTLGNTTFSAVMTATVFAFLSWAGFEACASLGEETDDPRRNIPRALIGVVALSGFLFVFVMFSETIGFGTDADGVAAFSGSTAPLSDLADLYLNSAFGMILAFTAAFAAFASALSSSAAAGRLVFALARDGFGPRPLARINPRSGVPTVALTSLVVVCLLIDLVMYAKGDAAFDVYYWYATLGVLCLLVVYAVAAAGVIVFTRTGLGNIAKWEMIFPVLAILYVAYIFYKQSTGQVAPYSWFPWIAGAWCIAGLAIVLTAPQLARRIGQRLTSELVDDGASADEIHQPHTRG